MSMSTETIDDIQANFCYFEMPFLVSTNELRRVINSLSHAILTTFQTIPAIYDGDRNIDNNSECFYEWRRAADNYLSVIG